MKTQTRYEYDCNNCQALCCSVLKQEQPLFPEDKPCNEACKNLTTGFQCKIHSTLANMGFEACIDFNCHGAGQLVSREFKRRMEFFGDSDAVNEKIKDDFSRLKVIHEYIVKLQYQGRNDALITILKETSEDYESQGSSALPTLKEIFFIIQTATPQQVAA